MPETSQVNGYDLSDFERPSVTVDVVIFTLREDDLQVLLVRRGEPPFKGRWAIPGGFANSDESLEQAAARELDEETGLSGLYLEQLYTFGQPGRDPRGWVISVAYFALVPARDVQLQAGDDAAEVAWHSAYDLPDLAFDHPEMLDYALTRLQYKLEYSTVGFQLLPEVFTLTELQRAYETVLGEKLDKRNFRRKILGANILVETGGERTGEGRPAKLYRYREDAEPEIKARRLFP
jgi:8-oxo-dGTP diphosphatase